MAWHDIDWATCSCLTWVKVGRDRPGMLRTTLLRLPRLNPARPPTGASDARRLVFSHIIALRHVSTTPNSLNPGENKPGHTDAVPQIQPTEPAPPSHESTSQDSTTHVKDTDAPADLPSSETARSTLGPVDVEEMKERLRSWSENAAILVRERADRYTAVAATTFGQLGRELNKVTGYGEIESLKRQVAEQGMLSHESFSLSLILTATTETRIRIAREAARTAKQELEKAVHERAKSQREVNDLLSRKSSWSDDDVGRFTGLVRQDHLYEQAEARAKAKAVYTEDEVDREFTELMRVILHRYHEEQIWSDKIRSASTYGSLTVIGLNLLIFMLAIMIVEPWKRRRLAQTFEKKVEEMSAETIMAFEEKSGDLTAQLKEQQRVVSQLVEAVNRSLQPVAALQAGEVPLETHISLPPSVESNPSRIPQLNAELVWTVATSATVAGVLGWIAGSWFGS